MNKQKIIFIIGMHRSGTSLLSNCLINNEFSIGKSKNTDKNWQNPNGYFENDNLLSYHKKLLKFNNSNWYTIRKKKMKYTRNPLILFLHSSSTPRAFLSLSSTQKYTLCERVDKFLAILNFAKNF